MNKEKTLKLLPDEYWWGGAVHDGLIMPYGRETDFKENLYGNLLGNQGCPLLISSKGRYVWSEEPFAFEFKEGVLTISGITGELKVAEGFKNLRRAYIDASSRYFPASGKIPDPLCFTGPQYNCWIDMLINPTQEKVLGYMKAILDSGMPPGVLMIDDWWYKHSGLWEWNREEFPEPKKMVDTLHKNGFKVIVWISPFVSADTRLYKELKKKGFLIMGSPMQSDEIVLKWKKQEQALKQAPEPVIRKWWNGYSSLLDLSNPECFNWLHASLDSLIDRYGIDGFKFDAGDPFYYKDTDIAHRKQSPNTHCEDFGRVGLKYALSEYRACWKLGGQHLLQRVRDKADSWIQGGMADIIPTALVQGLMGYPFTCPDMIGGGLGESLKRPGDPLFDQELYIRWTQCAVFFPVMQFSQLPARVLDKEHLKICMDMIKLRAKIGPKILELAKHASKTGEPILRPMAYNFPGEGTEKILDQYMFGDDHLIAPVMEQGARKKRIRFPGGTWKGDDGSVVEGPREAVVDAPLSRLPYYVKIG